MLLITEVNGVAQKALAQEYIDITITHETKVRSQELGVKSDNIIASSPSFTISPEKPMAQVTSVSQLKDGTTKRLGIPSITIFSRTLWLYS